MTSFHTDSPYAGDLHRAYMAWRYMRPLPVSPGSISRTKS